ncbi:MAG TPA: glycosyltransferase family 4 protein [Chitinophagaceae bacterium]
MATIICLAPYKFLPAKIGGQKAIASFYQTLSRTFKVICITTTNNEKEKAVNFECRNIIANTKFRYINIFYLFRFQKIIQKETADYFETEHPYFGWLAILLKRMTGVKIIIRSHNIEGLRFKSLNRPWWRILLAYEGWVYRNADHVFFITDEDRDYAVKQLKVHFKNAITIPFGILQNTIPPLQKRRQATEWLIKKHQLNGDEKIILFNGSFDYKPNIDALNHLVHFIFPTLQKQSNGFILIICGQHLPQEIISQNTNPAIIFAGFVDDIEIYLLGSNVFVNPITDGGGIKTKLVEALAFNLNSVSYTSGAIGITESLCGNKLFIVDDNDSTGFAEAILQAAHSNTDTPPEFFERFSTDNISTRLKEIL